MPMTQVWSSIGRSSKDRAITLKHPLVGTWIEEENRYLTTTVVFTVQVKQHCFCIRGIDENDGTPLKIRAVSWDGEALSFWSRYPPTKHVAHIVFYFVSKKKAVVEVTYSGEHGRDKIVETWKKRA
jgi:hypothetical protein